jgi:hypothetical protein
MIWVLVGCYVEKRAPFERTGPLLGRRTHFVSAETLSTIDFGVA